MITNNGIIVTWVGIIMPINVIKNSMFLPGKRRRANAKPAIELTRRLKNTVKTVTTTVLKKQRPQSAALNSLI